MNVREQLFEIERTFVPVHLFDPQRPRLIGLNRESKGRQHPVGGIIVLFATPSSVDYVSAVRLRHEKNNPTWALIP